MVRIVFESEKAQERSLKILDGCQEFKVEKFCRDLTTPQINENEAVNDDHFKRV